MISTLTEKRMTVLTMFCEAYIDWQKLSFVTQGRIAFDKAIAALAKPSDKKVDLALQAFVSIYKGMRLPEGEAGQRAYNAYEALIADPKTFIAGSKFDHAMRFAALADPTTRLLSLQEDCALRGVAYVEGVGMFILEAASYGLRDLAMENLGKRYPGKRRMLMGAAETIGLNAQVHQGTATKALTE